MKIYEHKGKKHIIYAIFDGEITVVEAINYERVVVDRLPDKGTIVRVIEYRDGVLTDKTFINRIGEFVKNFQDRIELSIVVGISGIRKIFYSMFLKVAKDKKKRLLFDNIEEVEHYFNLKIDRDFALIYSDD